MEGGQGAKAVWALKPTLELELCKQQLNTKPNLVQLLPRAPLQGNTTYKHAPARRIQTDQSSPLCQDIPSLPDASLLCSTRSRGAFVWDQKLRMMIQTHRAPQKHGSTSRNQPQCGSTSRNQPQCICLANTDSSRHKRLSHDSPELNKHCASISPCNFHSLADTHGEDLLLTPNTVTSDRFCVVAPSGIPSPGTFVVHVKLQRVCTKISGLTNTCSKPPQFI